MGSSVNWRVFVTCFISFFFSQKTLAQKGFLSFQCCAVSNFSDPATGITWTSDDDFFRNVGTCGTVSIPVSNDTSYTHVRIFGTSGGNRWCYNLTTISSEVYLIRATFLHGRSLETSPGTLFNVSLGPTIISQVNASTDSLEVETVSLATSDSVNFCLIKGNGIPFLSQLELRPLNSSVHLEVNSSVILKLLKRVDLGNTNGDLRFPVDPFDRIWSKDESSVGITFTSLNASIKDVNSSVPIQVLQTAVINSSALQFSINSLDAGDGNYLICLYFLELNSSVLAGQRVFDIYANGERKYEKFDILENGTNYQEFLFHVHASGLINISLVSVSDELGPMCNAYEVYQLQDRVPGTAQQDVAVLLQMREQFLENNINNSAFGQWSGDPCLPLSPDGLAVPWEGLQCEPRKEGFVITKLDLSSHSLRGSLPTVISGLSELQELNLCSNQLTGTIIQFPTSSMITSINVQNNNLTGAIPESFASLPHLMALLFGCNSLLNKTIPAGLLNRANFSSDFGNCGSENETRMQPHRSKIFIGSVAAGSLLLSVAAVAIFTFFYKRRHYPDGKTQLSKSAVFSVPIMDEEELKSIKIQTFSLEYIETVTCKYKTMIGEGGFGAVYRGTLTHGQEVAVKVRSATSAQGTREFENELNLLSAIQHENLVPLLGYCSDNDQQILVYPFMSNGSLQDRLYGESAKVRKPLDWQTRLSIALGAARGLLYLHTFCGRCVIHRDVKSSNILLDHSMCAKVADFGFSKYAPQEGDSGASLEVRGTAGYLDPEYYSTQQLSVKSDVFSFGVVLLEIICGREPLNIHRPRNEWSLVEWAKPFIRESRIEEVVDSTIKGGYTAEAMWRVVEVVLACIEPFSVYRPCMADIVRELEDALIIENNASEYMRSIESFGGSCRFSSVDKKIPATPIDPSPIFPQAMAPPLPR